MNSWPELAMIVLVLTDLSLLGMTRLGTCITVVAGQGILLGLFALAAQPGELTERLAVIGIAGIVLKGLVFPALIRRAVREAGVQRELEPFVGYVPSVLIGIGLLGVALWLTGRLPLRLGSDLPLAVPATLLTMFTGLFLVIARRKALTQCLGYLVLENGIYAFGVVVVGEVPALVELGLLLDAFVAVLVMGVALYRINREFDHLDADRLNELKG